MRYNYKTGVWSVGLLGCIGCIAYTNDQQGWMRQGGINGPYASLANGQPIHLDDPIIALAFAWYSQQVVH